MASTCTVVLAKAAISSKRWPTPKKVVAKERLLEQRYPDAPWIID
jgi:hypothetical protein